MALARLLFSQNMVNVKTWWGQRKVLSLSKYPKLCEYDISKSTAWIFTKLSPLMYFDIKIAHIND